jgi:hypothetical protein
MLCVPQDLKEHDLSIDAFFPKQNCIQIQLTANKAENLVVQSSSSLSVAFILQSLHEHLHSAVPRQQFAALRPESLATAQKSLNARNAKIRGVVHQGVKVLDVLGFGATDVILVGLKKGDGVNEWIPVFTARS